MRRYVCLSNALAATVWPGRGNHTASPHSTQAFVAVSGAVAAAGAVVTVLLLMTPARSSPRSRKSMEALA